MSDNPKLTSSATGSGGLSQAEAQRRLARYGYNKLSEKHINPLLTQLTYFNGCDGLH